MKRRTERRRVMVMTETRGDYGLLKPLMTALSRHPRLDLQIFVTGSHLSRDFGYTVREIEEDGLKIAWKSRIVTRDDTEFGMTVTLGRCVIGAAQAMRRLKPHFVVILGDRLEGLATASAATYMGVAICHLHGGDRALGSLDEYARRAITKLSHLHFTATRTSAGRILKLNEEPWRVKVVGAPGIDSIRTIPPVPLEHLAKKYGFRPVQPVIAVLQHPTREADKAVPQMRETLEALVHFGYEALVIYPNIDAGSRAMIRLIDRYQKYRFIHPCKNMDHPDFINLLRRCAVLVGNSSAGIIETPFLKTPVVNMGDRQGGRERSTNVIDIPHEKGAIVRAVRRALTDRAFRRRVRDCLNPYGDGRSSERIVRVLAGIPLDKKLLFKVN